MTDKHPYPKWLQWLLPFEHPDHEMYWPGDDGSTADEQSDQALDDLEEILGKDYVDRLRNF